MSDFERRIRETRERAEEEQRRKQREQKEAQRQAEEDYRQRGAILAELGVGRLGRMLKALREELDKALEVAAPSVRWSIRSRGSIAEPVQRSGEVCLCMTSIEGDVRYRDSQWIQERPLVGVRIVRDGEGHAQVLVFAESSDGAERCLGVTPYSHSERVRILQWVGDLLAQWFEDVIGSVSEGETAP